MAKSRKPEPLTITEVELWPMPDAEKVKIGIAFTGGDIELIIGRMEAARLVGALRTHFGL